MSLGVQDETKECGCDDLTCGCDITGRCLSRTGSPDCNCVETFQIRREGEYFFGHDRHWKDWTDSISDEAKDGSFYLFLQDLPRANDLNHVGVWISTLTRRVAELESEVRELRNQT